VTDEVTHRHGVRRYRSVTEGVAMANEYLSSRLGMSEFARRKGVSFKMVKYWSVRARQLAASAGSASAAARSGSLVRIGTMDDEHGLRRSP
jgi:hypothetical protein